MSYVTLLQEWVDDQKSNNGLVDVKFFPIYFPTFGDEPPVKMFDGPDPTPEQLAEAAYKLLTGETPSEEIDVSELDL
jgi:hypothetical protein